MCIHEKEEGKALRNGPLGALRRKNEGRRGKDLMMRNGGKKIMCDFLRHVFEICETSDAVEIPQFQR